MGYYPWQTFYSGMAAQFFDPSTYFFYLTIAQNQVANLSLQGFIQDGSNNGLLGGLFNLTSQVISNPFGFRL